MLSTSTRWARHVSNMDICGLAAIVTACCLAVWTFLDSEHPPRTPVTAGKSVALPPAPVALTGAPTLGSASAPIGMIEYSDFQCPFCRSFAIETLPLLKERYIHSGKLLFAFRHRPLTTIHPLAYKGSEAAECAARQNKFWQMHDQLFRKQPDFDVDLLGTWAERVGVEKSAFETCLHGQAVSRVSADSSEAAALGISGTPEFIIGSFESGTIRVTHRLTGALPFEKFAEVFETLLAQK